MAHRAGSFMARIGKAYKWVRPLALTLLLLLLTTSCALAPGREGMAAGGAARPDTPSTDRPKSGDVKMMGGTEYIYGKNVRWPTMAGEPEYVWIRKDQYASRPFDSLTEGLSGSIEDRKKMEELRARIEHLEREMKKLDDAGGAQEKR